MARQVSAASGRNLVSLPAAVRIKAPGNTAPTVNPGNAAQLLRLMEVHDEKPQGTEGLTINVVEQFDDPE